MVKYKYANVYLHICVLLWSCACLRAISWRVLLKLVTHWHQWTLRFHRLSQFWSLQQNWASRFSQPWEQDSVSICCVLLLVMTYRSGHPLLLSLIFLLSSLSLSSPPFCQLLSLPLFSSWFQPQPAQGPPRTYSSSSLFFSSHGSITWKWLKIIFSCCFFFWIRFLGVHYYYYYYYYRTNRHLCHVTWTQIRCCSKPRPSSRRAYLQVI